MPFNRTNCGIETNLFIAKMSMNIPFNRTNCGIETQLANKETRRAKELLIAPIMELKRNTTGREETQPDTFNRTNYGIETILQIQIIIEFIDLLIAPIMELKHISVCNVSI